MTRDETARPPAAAAEPGEAGAREDAGTAAEGRPRLVRDRVTIGLYTPYAMWGWLLYSFNPSVPLLADELGVSSAQAGLHGTAMAGGALLASAVAPRAVLALGRRRTVVLLCLVVVVGVVGLLAGPSLPWTLAAMLVTSLGGAGGIAATQVGLAEHTGRAASAAITEANGVGSGIGLVGPIAVGACVAAGWGWRPGVAVTAVLGVVAALVVSRLPLPGPRRTGGTAPDAPASRSDADAPRSTVGAYHRTALVTFLAALLCAIAIENATTYWSADLVVDRTGAGPGIATATTAGLVAGMTAVRFVVGPLSLRLAPAHLLVGSFLLAVLGWAVLWTASTEGMALTGLAVAGVGYGAQYPLSVALLLATVPEDRDRAQAYATFAGAVALGLAPFVLGALSDAAGVHQAFLVVPVLAVVGAAAAAVGGRAGRRAERERAAAAR